MSLIEMMRAFHEELDPQGAQETQKYIEAREKQLELVVLKNDIVQVLSGVSRTFLNDALRPAVAERLLKAQLVLLLASINRCRLYSNIEAVEIQPNIVATREGTVTNRNAVPDAKILGFEELKKIMTDQ